MVRVPTATYRIQLSQHCTFGRVAELAGYLHTLGISDLYASPILKARPGSSHGYDITDPSRINPELGGQREFRKLHRELKRYGMGLLLDIVPNHLAASSENPYWTDVLQHGGGSRYARYFDIRWDPAGTGGGQVLVPVLGRPYGEALEAGELRLVVEEGMLRVRYADWSFPLPVRSWGPVLSRCLARPELSVFVHADTLERLGAAAEEVDRLRRGFQGARERRRGEEVEAEIKRLMEGAPGIRAAVHRAVLDMNGRPGCPRSFDLLDRLLREQHYRLAYWRMANEEINYRRFFDIGDLVGVRVEDEEVLRGTHRLIFRLVDRGGVTGLRVDHVDGLRDPEGYLERMQGRLGRDGRPYVVVEKVLGEGEELPSRWPVCGTTGYDFLNAVNRLLSREDGVRAIEKDYREVTGREEGFPDVLYESKKQVMRELFSSDVSALVRDLAELARRDRHACDLTVRELRRAVEEVTACLPMYRSYTAGPEVSEQDRKLLRAALEEAGQRAEGLPRRALDFVGRVVLHDLPESGWQEGQAKWVEWVMRWQQFTGAVTAKGLEDTALYNYNPVTWLNEVGGNPGAGALSLEEFHRFNMARQERWPYTMNATATHDTKRGEDTRARLQVLSEMPEVWRRAVRRWRRWNRHLKREVKGVAVPEPEMEVLLYQAMVGAWPLQSSEREEFRSRVKAYATKAAREGKRMTSWLEPDDDYEAALADFVDGVFDDGGGSLRSMELLAERIAFHGAVNSLAQTVLKIGCPGMPDFYQGSELWDLSLVDPDNRRPVDLDVRTKGLQELMAAERGDRKRLLRRLLRSWRDGRMKQYTVYKGLELRGRYAEVFRDGDYEAVYARGEMREHVCCFVRRKGDQWVLVAVPRFPAALTKGRAFPLGRRVWDEGELSLPEGAPERWWNGFSGEEVEARGGGTKLADLFARWPVAMLWG